MKYLLSICFVLLTHVVIAQERHFMFIQSDNNQPFYVSMNGKVYSSSATGYLIVPKLIDGTYSFVVGFAKNEYPEQSFQAVIDKRDLGFNLKNLEGKGWGLFNLQTLELTLAGDKPVQNTAANIPKGDEPISFNKKPVEPVKPSIETTAPASTGTTLPETPVTNSDTIRVAAVTPPDTAPALQQVPVSPAQPLILDSSSITQLSADTSKAGLHLAFLDKASADTIQVTIPSATPATPMPASTPAPMNDAAVTVPESPAKSTEVAAEKPADDKQPKFLDISVNALKEPAATVQATPTTNCKNIANEDDYWKLRKKMSGEDSDEKMILEAKKFYRNKCFTTEQIKNLSTLFMSDEGRLKFFDASYVSVADPGQYYMLESQLIDPAYLNRFKLMLQ